MTPAQTTATPVSISSGRLYYVDNLRVALTVLVVLHHVAVTYGNIPLWFYTEPAKDPSGLALDLLVSFNQAFFMGFFFLVSGFFTPGALDRKGGRAFFRDRLIRLGIPLLVFLLVLRPLVNFGSYPSVAAATGDPGLPYWLFYLYSWDPGPMWFVEVLLLFAAVYAVARRFAGPVREVPAAAPRARAIAGFTAGLVVVTFLWRLVVPIGLYVPVLGLPSAAYLPQYAGLFAVGVVAYRRGWFASLPRRAGRIGFLVASAVTAALLPVVVITPPGAAQTLVQSLWETVFATGVILGLLVLFRDRFDRQGKRGRFLSQQAYTVYFIHPVVLVGLGHAFSGLHAPAIVKFAVVAAFALPICWAAAYLVRSLPGAKRVL
ncbi:acyltransferase family protein [Streptosporangium sp. KLBMP 9127]|nr:acyltransferase [Streptosporangium sp. KLBMP 9127]